jgi:hypothetical protein
LEVTSNVGLREAVEITTINDDIVWEGSLGRFFLPELNNAIERLFRVEQRAG